MSEYEKINARVEANKAGQKKWLVGRIAWIVGTALAVGLGLWGLNAIGFISNLFWAILMSGDALVGAFNIGRACNEANF